MKIRLGKQRFWLDPWRFEIWPELLSNLPAEIEATTAKELAVKYLDLEIDDSGRLNHNEELYGLFAWKRMTKDKSYKLKGVNFINKGQLQQSARDLAAAYKADNEREWLILLGEQLLKYSPRLRAVIIAMLEDNPLKFETAWFKAVYNKTAVDYQGETFYPFYRDDEQQNLNNLLAAVGFPALGPWWAKELGVAEEEIKWLGSRGQKPTLSGIARLRCPLELFLYLGWLKKYDTQTYYLEQEQFKRDISLELVSELTETSNEQNELELLKELVVEYKDFRGYFPLHKVGQALHSKLGITEEADKWIEKFFKAKLADNQLKILSHQSGQPRHGRGLYGKRDYQLLKVEFLD